MSAQNVYENPRIKPLPIETVGLFLAANRNEFRTLIVGAVAIAGGPIETTHIIHDLKKVRYDDVQPVQTNQITDHIDNTPVEVLDKTHLEGLGVVAPTTDTSLAVSLGGVLLKEFGGSPDVNGIQSLTGRFVPTSRGGSELPGPAFRYILLDAIIKGGVANISDLNKLAAEYDQTPAVVRRHLKSLEKSGYLEHKKAGKGTDWSSTLSGRPIINKYVTTINKFANSVSEDGEGYDYVHDLLDPDSPESVKTPFLVRRSIATSGRDDTPVLDAFANQIGRFKGLGITTMTTGEVADLFDITVPVAYQRLYHLSNRPNGTILTKLSDRHGKETIWDFSSSCKDDE